MAELGEPIEAGLIPQGSISISGNSGEADLKIPIHGPRGGGAIFVVASKKAGKWEYEVCEVELEKTGRRISLRTPELEQVL